MKDFDEQKHPRDEEGKFTETGGETQYRQNTPYEEITEDTTMPVSDLDKLMGEEFKGIKGQAAIDKLMKEKHGHVKGAFHRDDIGDIDLLWGNDALGLQHIIKRREEQRINIQTFIANLSEVIESGNLEKKNARGNFEIWHEGKMAVIAPELYGHRITYVLTAYKQSRKNYKAP